MSSPDPISDPQGYQQHLLGLLGDDDPAEVQAATPARLRTLLDEAGDDLRAVPEPGEWSVFGCLAHLTDAEVVMSARYRWVLAQDEPPLVGYDQDLWVDHLHTEAAQESPESFWRSSSHCAGRTSTCGDAPRSSHGRGWVSTPSVDRRVTTWPSA